MNSIGRKFRISILGESHGPVCGAVIDGVPPGISINKTDFEIDLARRRPGQKGTTERVESDVPHIKSGVFQEKTTGAPIYIEFKNRNINSDDYKQDVWRPGHADFTAEKKYKGYNDFRGSGHFSGRLTVALVAAGVIAKKIIKPMAVAAEIEQVGGEKDYRKLLESVIADGDSLGGVIACKVSSVPRSLGEPFFDSVESTISHLVFSIPGVRGIEFGSGFNATKMRGSEHNDVIEDADGKTLTNHCGGINGGITNGNPLFLRVAVKPTSTIKMNQTTYYRDRGEVQQLSYNGRHDAAFVLRVPVIIESVVAIALADFLLIEK